MNHKITKNEQYEIEDQLKELFKIGELHKNYLIISFALVRIYKRVFNNHAAGDAFMIDNFTCRIIYNRKSGTINISFKYFNQEEKLTFFQTELAEFIYYNDNEYGVKRVEGVIYEII